MIIKVVSICFHNIHRLITLKFTQFDGTAPARLFKFRFFNVHFSGMILYFIFLCAKETLFLKNVETIFFFNFKPTGRRNNLNYFPPSTYAPYLKKDYLYIGLFFFAIRRQIGKIEPHG